MEWTQAWRHTYEVIGRRIREQWGFSNVLPEKSWKQNPYVLWYTSACGHFHHFDPCISFEQCRDIIWIFSSIQEKVSRNIRKSVIKLATERRKKRKATFSLLCYHFFLQRRRNLYSNSLQSIAQSVKCFACNHCENVGNSPRW